MAVVDQMEHNRRNTNSVQSESDLYARLTIAITFALCLCLIFLCCWFLYVVIRFRDTKEQSSERNDNNATEMHNLVVDRMDYLRASYDFTDPSRPPTPPPSRQLRRSEACLNVHHV